MKNHIIETEVWLPHPRESVFEFFKAAENLQIITPPWLEFQIKTPLPIVMIEGTLINYKLRLYGIPLKWRTKITKWEPPDCFIDKQLKGPYTKWVHTHYFSEKNGGTLMCDRVEYRVPGGTFSGIIHKWFVRKNVEKIFAYRQKVIREIFSNEGRAGEMPANLLQQKKIRQYRGKLKWEGSLEEMRSDE